MKKTILFYLEQNKELASQLKLLNADSVFDIGTIQRDVFADSEMKLRAIEDVRGRNVIVLASTSSPVNERLMEVMILVDGLKRGNAKKVTLMSPYFGYSRQDRGGDLNEPVTLQLVGALLKESGVDEIINIEPHTHHKKGFFPIPFIELSTEPLFAEYYLQLFKKLNIENKDLVILAPDHGSINRGKHLQEFMPGAGFASIEKERYAPDHSRTVRFEGDVKGKTIIIYDDIASTSKTILAAVQLAKSKGAVHIFVGVSHAVFSSRSNELLHKLSLDGIAATNSIEKRTSKGMKVLSVAELIYDYIVNNCI